MKGIHRVPVHAYEKDGSGRVPGITTAIGVIDKGWALTNWNRMTTARAAMSSANAKIWHPHLKHDKVEPSCVACMSGWAKDSTPEDRAARWLAKFPGFESQQKMDLGSYVHHIAEVVARGEKVDFSTIPDEAMPFVESWVRDFLEGGRTPGKSRPTFHPAYLEFSVYREQDDVCLAYGGTMDLACRLGDETVLADYKTGAGVYDETRLQLAAGGQGAFCGQLCPGCHDDKGKTPHVATKTYRPPRITAYAVIHIRPEATEYIPVDVKPTDFEAFAHARGIWQWKEQMKGRAA